MKKSILLSGLFSFVLFSSLAAFAQNNVSSVRASAASGRNVQKGFFVGFDYMNLTDVHMKVESKFGNQTKSDTYEGGTSLGMAGFRLGYNHTPESGFGFEAGARYLDSLNRSEYGTDRVQFIIPEANAKFAFNSYFLGYAGANVSFMRGSTYASDYTPGLGGQFGFGVRFANDLALNAGYTMLGQTYKDSNSYSEYKAEYLISGFNSNLTYTF